MSSSNWPPRDAVRFLMCGALIAACTLAGPAAASAAADCPNVDVEPSADNIEAVRAGILCLANAERSQRGLVVLRENARLRRAARGHSADMVREGYFAHTEPDGDTFVDRIVDSRYTRRDGRWTLGENLAWGTGQLETARGVHDAWMRSRSHRAIILKPAFRDLGIGVFLGIPTDPDVGVTFTTDFGVKS